MMPGLQEWIHKIEEGEGARYVRLAFMLLALLGLTAVWHIREARSFASIEAMDAAQVARNLAQGEGFSTDFVRPLSIALIREHQGASAELGKGPHPDLANAPLYPALLAGLMKVLPFDWSIPEANFWRYQPEVLIGWFNQALFFLALWLVYRLGARLFDPGVGYLAAALMALTELFWDFATSGLSTMLLLVLFLALVHVLVSLEHGAREGGKSRGWIYGQAALAGLIVGAMALTRYSAGWLIVPVAGFIAAYAAGARGPAAALAVAVAGLALSPWLARNHQICGRAFGTAGLAIYEESSLFPGNTLARSMPKSLALELNRLTVDEYVRKLFVNSRDILDRDLPQAAGNWVAALFLGALLVPYRNPILGRLKLFAVSAVLVLVLVQALGRTALSEHTPRLNSENLLVLVAPLFFLFGAAVFFTLLDQIPLPFPLLRTLVVAGSVFVLSLPLVFRLLPPRTMPSIYPPYYAPLIQSVSHWLEPHESMMSDMPWASAWYGGRESVWVTLDYGAKAEGDFYEINDHYKAIKGIYLTPITTDAKLLNEMWRPREGAWGKFYLEVLVKKNVPTGFPLKFAPPALMPDQLFISDRIRWRE